MDILLILMRRKIPTLCLDFNVLCLIQTVVVVVRRTSVLGHIQTSLLLLGTDAQLPHHLQHKEYWGCKKDRKKLVSF
jgi:hypothetical protein